jgi:hypothetical protein
MTLLVPEIHPANALLYWLLSFVVRVEALYFHPLCTRLARRRIGQEPAATYWGYDVVPELLAKAREKVPGVTFSQGSVLERSLLTNGSLDVAFMIGAHEIFDDFVPFQLPFDLAPRGDDPVRTWTFMDQRGQRLLRNGLALLVNLELLEIYR